MTGSKKPGRGGNGGKPGAKKPQTPARRKGRPGPQVQFCSLCGETGHNRRKCPKRRGGK